MIVSLEPVNSLLAMPLPIMTRSGGLSGQCPDTESFPVEREIGQPMSEGARRGAARLPTLNLSRGDNAFR